MYEYEAGVTDDIFAVLGEANRKSEVAVMTPNGLSRRETLEDIACKEMYSHP